MAHIYISCALSVSELHLYKVQTAINDLGHWWSCWDRKEPRKYDNGWLDTADAVVFVLPNNAWQMSYMDMPIGLVSELNRCRYQGKKMFLAYETSSSPKQIRFYEIADRPDKGIKGRVATSHVFTSGRFARKPDKDIVVQNIQPIDNQSFAGDIRLLLRKR